MNNILAIDPGKSTGWASCVNGVVESGVVKFTVERGEGRGMLFLKFNSWLHKMLDLIEPQLVVYEMAHMRGGSATEVLVGMTTRIMEQCERHFIEQYTKVHSATLKKFATGSGRASKEEMIAGAVIRFGKPVLGDDEADALWMMEYARTQYSVGNELDENY